MKKSIIAFSIICLLACSFSVCAQTIRRVNNDPVITGINIYTSPQAAHDAAVAGDILVIEPTNVLGTYSSLIITKQVSIISNGYLLTKNTQTLADKRNPYINSVTFNKGSAGSSITGLEISSSLIVNCDNITISRCNLPSISMGSNGSNPTTYGSNLFVSKSIIRGFINGSNGIPPGDYCIFQNNLIVGASFQAIITSLENSTLTNNTLIPINYGQFLGQIGNLINCSVSNNIFDWRNFPSSSPQIYSSESSNFSNNISIGTAGLPSGNGNVNSATTTNLYLNSDPLSVYTNLGESVFKLGVGSPAIGIGTGGTDAGAFGGSSPYILSGLPPIPVITIFNTSAIGNSSTPINISVTVRGNN